MLKLYWEQLLQTLFHDPGHAWIYLSLCFLVGSLAIHYVLTGSVRTASRRISSKNLKSLQNKYLFRSFSGWFFYLVSLGFFLLFWYAHYFQTLDMQSMAVFFAAGSVLTFLLAVIAHLTAYARSCLDQIKQLEDQQLTP